MLGPVRQHAVEHRRVRAAEGDGAFARRLVGGRVKQSARQSQDGHEQRVVPGARQGEGRQRGRGGDRCSRGGVHAASLFQHASLLGEVHFVVTVAYSRVRRGRIEAGAARARRLGARAQAAAAAAASPGESCAYASTARTRRAPPWRRSRTARARRRAAARAEGARRAPRGAARRRRRRRAKLVRQLTSLRGGETVPNHPGARHRARQRVVAGSARDGSRRDRSRTASRLSRTRTRPGKDPVARRFRPRRRRPPPVKGRGRDPRRLSRRRAPKQRAASARPGAASSPRAAAARAERAAAPAGAPGRPRRAAPRRRPRRRAWHNPRQGPRCPGPDRTHRRGASRRSSAPTPASSSSRARAARRRRARLVDRDAPASLRGFGFFWKRFAVEARRDFFVRLL